jgi:hypothetical protein
MKTTLYTLTALLLSCLTTVAQVSNAGFEDWDSLSFVDNQRIYDPIEWLSTNQEMVSIGKSQPISISTDAHTGSHAALITSMVDDGEMQNAILVSEKFPLTGRIKYFEAWYKYTPVNTDSFRVHLALYKNGQNYGQAYIITGDPKNEYTKIHWELTYPDNVPAPDSARFLIYASIYNDSEGSELLIDDMSVGYQATGLDDVKDLPRVTAFPNPAVDQITLLGYHPPKRMYYSMHNSKGALVKQGTVDGASMSVGDLAPGLYFVQLNDEDGWNQQLKFLKQ